MNRASWLPDYFEDYMFKSQRELSGNDGREQTGVGKGAVRGKNRQMPVRNGVPHAHAEEHDASNHSHRNVPRGYPVLGHRRDTRPERTNQRQKSKRSRLAMSSRKDVASPKARVSKLWYTNVQSVIVLAGPSRPLSRGQGSPPRKGNVKIGHSMLRCPVSIGSVSHRTSRMKKK